MTDSIIKQTGNSRYLKSAIGADTTFEQFLEMLRNGTLPIDLNGINPDGFAELGTALNKANLLSDETAELFGLGAEAVPDEVLKKAKQLITTSQNTANSAPKIVTGSYVGNGEQWGDPRSISFSGISSSYLAILYSVSNYPFFLPMNSRLWIPAGVVNVSYPGSLSSNKFTVDTDSYGSNGLNQSGEIYYYIIFGR